MERSWARPYVFLFFGNGQTLVTRGNVAIYCYNALTARTWDVTESTDGKLTSSSKGTETILAKYFSDFTNEAGDMKLVEDAKVEATGATTAKYGANQIVLSVEEGTYFNSKGADVGIAGFINAESEPRKGEEEVTYAKGNNVVAYVPAEVADIANLSGKKVEVIFGKDNEVAYLEVVSDVVDNSFVTAWDATDDDAEIEIDDEEYDLLATAKVSVFGYPIDEVEDKCVVCGNAEASCTKSEHTFKATPVSAIDVVAKLFGSTKLNCVTKGELTRKVVADIELTPDDEIEAINFKFSAAYDNGDVKVEEHIVEDVTAKKFVYADTSKSIEDLEKAEPRVVKNDKVATLDDIAAGDVLTIITIGDNIVIYAVSNTVEGTVLDYIKNSNTLEIDDEEYTVATSAYYNVEGEADKLNPVAGNGLLAYFVDEEATAYLNMFGEVVAVVGESEITGMTLGVVTSYIETTTDADSDGVTEDIETLIDSDNDDVEYLKVKILAEDGTNRSYKIYNENTKKNIDKADQWSTIKTLVTGSIVVFSAEDRVIKSDDIKIVNANGTNEYDLADSKLVATTIDPSKCVADIDNKRVTEEGATSATTDDTIYKFNDSTVIININENAEELISWKALTDSTDSNATKLATTASTNMVFFTKGTKVLYAVVDVTTPGVSDKEFGIITAFGRDYDEDGDRFYTVTILTDGEEATYECADTLRDNYEVGDLVDYKVSDDTIATTNVHNVAKAELVEKLAELIDEDKFTSEILAMFATSEGLSTSEALEYIKVAAVDAQSIEFEYSVPVACTKCSTVDNLKDCTCDESDADAVAACTTCKGAGEVSAACTEHKPTEKTLYRIVYLDEDVLVYNLVNGEMGEVAEEDYVLVLNTDSDATDYEIVVIVK